MSVTKFFGAFAPAPKRVKLKVFKQIRRDLTIAPTFDESWKAATRAFKAQRRRECAKPEAPLIFPYSNW